MQTASVAQSAERKPFKLVVVGSSPTVGTKAVWSSGMILALGASGRGFDSPSGPILNENFTNLGSPLAQSVERGANNA